MINENYQSFPNYKQLYYNNSRQQIMLIILLLSVILVAVVSFAYSYFRTHHIREGLTLDNKATYLKAMNLTSSPHCSENWTFCNQSNGSMCCPLENGVCCSESLTCCPQGTACSEDGLTCNKI